MTLTEAYITSIPESFLIIAISILIINGLVGVEKPAFIQNPLLAEASKGEAVSSGTWISAPLSKKKLDKSVLPLGILSLSLASILVSNIDVTYIGRFILDDYSKTIKIIVLLGSVVLLFIGLDATNNTAKSLTHAKARLNAFRSRTSLVTILEPNLELCCLMILAVVGLMIIISSYDLLSLYVGIELQSLALYVLAAYKSSSEFSTEAGLKYFILGAISSGFLLFGSSIVYGVTGTTQFEEIAKVLLLKDQTVIIGLLFVFSGLFFKASIAPFHQWTPDVYEGSPTLVTLLFASIPKLAIFSILVRILSFVGIPSSYAGSEIASEVTQHAVFSLTSVPVSSTFSIVNMLIMACAVLSLTIGAITGLYQQKLKRLLAYSTILNMGYVLIGLVSFSIDGLQALFFYLLIYLFTNLGVFTILLAVKELRNNQLHSLVYITDLQKLRNQPLLAFSFIIIISSFAGFPPLAGFYAKLYVFFSALALQYYVLLIVAVIMSVISCFYYLRLIKYVYFTPLTASASLPPTQALIENQRLTVFLMPLSLIHSLVIASVVLCLIVFMFYPGPLLTLSLSLALNVLS
jgi:NADH-quinone oxidoreductase subunit N